MTRTREVTTRLLKEIIRGKLRGGIDSRTSAIKTCTDLLAAMRMSQGRTWLRGCREFDTFVAEQRHLAADTKIGPGLRADACRRLCVLAGYSSPDILGEDDADRYTRTLTAVGTKPSALAPSELSPAEAALETWNRERERER
jgi:hypothetical protein